VSNRPTGMLSVCVVAMKIQLSARTQTDLDQNRFTITQRGLVNIKV